MKKPYLIKGNIHGIILLRLFIVLIALIMSRLFLYFLNLNFWSDLDNREIMRAISGGILFDLSTLCIIAAPYIFFNTLPIRVRTHPTYQTMNNILFYILVIMALAANFIDVVYSRFTGKRMTADIFSLLNAGDNYAVLIPQMLKDFWLVGLLWIILSAFTITSVEFTQINRQAKNPSGVRFYIINTILFLIFSFATIIGIRGGFQLRPMSIITAGKFSDAKNTPLVLNSPFTIVKSLGQLDLKRLNFFRDEQKLNAEYTPIHSGFKTNDSSDCNGFNVVIIIMESFSSEYIGAFSRDLDNGHYEGFTPFLDSVISVSLSYNGYANGKKSIEAIPAILSSLPALMNNPYITSSYAGDRINSLASVLKERGYSSSFFHGGTNGTMGFESFIQMAGFDRYVGRTEYNNDNDYDGQWGIFDEPFFQYYAQCLDTTRRPFVSAIFSLSSHHPYRIPPQYEGKFKKGPLKIHESVGYSDYCLKRFFETVSKMNWYDSTLFIITADHTSETYYPEYQTRIGIYRIPIIFYRPGGALKGTKDEIVQQTDIMPSILSFLNYDKTYFAFGESVFDSTSKRFNVSYLNGIYQLIMDDYVFEWDGLKPFSLNDFKNDPQLKTDLKAKNVIQTIQMEDFIKAIVQQYNNRMIDNKLIAN
jgi:phosphoglycerol transferase MdoB-like AlkP superfamily enzyme